MVVGALLQLYIRTTMAAGVAAAAAGAAGRSASGLGGVHALWAAATASGPRPLSSGGALNSAICYAQLCTTQSRSDQLGLDSPIGPFLWTLGG